MEEAPARSDDALVELLRALLPEGWRREVSVTRYPGGFSVRCADEDGRRHCLEVRPVSQGETEGALVVGDALAYGYTLVDPAVDAELYIDRYREALSAIAERENDLTPLLDAAPAVNEGVGASPATPSSAAAVPYPNEEPAPAELGATLTRALPEAWRNDVGVTLSPDGFVLRFSDAEGRRHALDARAKGEGALVTGDELGYAYTLVDARVDEAATLDAYRAALTAIAAREAEVLPWLKRRAAAPPAELHADVRSFTPSPDERPAPSQLVEVVTGALPPGLRHDVVVTLAPGGFVLRCRDAEGGRHIFDAREARPDAPTLVSGRALGFSYLRPDEAAQETALVGDYRMTLGALAAREAEVLPWLTLPAAAAERDAVVHAPTATEAASPYPNESPAPPELAAVLAAALPDEWRRDAAATLSPGGFVLRFTDAEGRRHALDARPLGEGAFVPGRELGYSYTIVDPRVDESSMLDAYRAALTAIAAREAEVTPWIAAAEPPPAPPAVETAPPTMDPFPNEVDAPPALVNLVASALPEAWRYELRVTLAPDGFVARFRDGAGAAHALEARPVDAATPALVNGRALGFSYLRVDPSADDTALAGEYRAVLANLAAREADLVPLVGLGAAQGRYPHAQPAPRELSAFLAQFLPPGWRREVEVRVAMNEGYAVSCLSDDGVPHRFESGPRGAEGLPVDGDEMSYGMARGAVPTAEELAVLRVLAEHERDVLRVASGAPSAGRDPRRWSRDYPDSTAAPAALSVAVSNLLPDAWTREVEVVLFPAGFAVSFRDEGGVRHVLEGRLLEAGFPSLVRGHRMGFAYLKVDANLDENSAVPRYREVLQRFAAQDAALAMALGAPASA